MARRPNAQELIVGVTTDAVFGPVILFGHGGTAVEVIADRAIGLPPLNGVLARELIARTRVSKLLAGYRDRMPADLTAISRTLIQVSHLIADIPRDRRARHQPAAGPTTRGWSRSMRACASAPIRGERLGSVRHTALSRGARGVDQLAAPASVAATHQARRRRTARRVLNALDPEDVHFRFFMRMRELQRPQLARLTQIDYDREMAFIATCERDPGRFETLGVARVIADPDNVSAEFAIIVRSKLKGQGLGLILLRKLIAYCRSRGTREVVGEGLSGQ